MICKFATFYVSLLHVYMKKKIIVKKKGEGGNIGSCPHVPVVKHNNPPTPKRKSLQYPACILLTVCLGINRQNCHK